MQILFSLKFVIIVFWGNLNKNRSEIGKFKRQSKKLNRRNKKEKKIDVFRLSCKLKRMVTQFINKKQIISLCMPIDQRFGKHLLGANWKLGHWVQWNFKSIWIQSNDEINLSKIGSGLAFNLLFCMPLYQIRVTLSIQKMCEGCQN